MSSYFKNKTKAEVLSELKKQKLKFKIPKTYYFSVAQWTKKSNIILKEIISKFQLKKFIAIRSSSKDEDKINISNAGKFSSHLKIPLNRKKIKFAIESVLKSYEKQIDKKKLQQNQILIQEMIINTSMSGVIFTRDLDTGANYYSINYDDVTGLTNTVTSGQGQYSNRTLLIYKEASNQIRSQRFKTLILAVKDLEKKINDQNIDIEFGVTKNFTPYLFQVRPIISNSNWQLTPYTKFNKNLIKIAKNLKPKFKRVKNIHGKTTVFGQMPDWNPAEIIGKNPSKLAYSLYSELITKNIWAKARKLMGYKDLSKFNLMSNIGEQPYIDTRLSFNSFLPASLKKKISEKIIDNSIKKLKNDPSLHDKIEFDIAITSFSFDFNEKIKKLYGSILNKKEKKIFKKNIKELTIKNFDKSNQGSLNKALEKIEKLKNLQQTKKLDKIFHLKEIISNCKKLGTLPFSILARHGFIGRDLLFSLYNKKILNFNEIENFQTSLKTVTSEMINDLKKLDKKNFLLKYGHLRPGTYDIMSKRYDQLKGFNIGTQSKNKKKMSFMIDKSKKTKIKYLLNKNKFNMNTTEELFDYIKNSIISREYAKFIFTKSISLILEIIANHGKKLNLSREQLSHIPISFFLDKNKYSNKNKLKIISTINKKRHLLSKSIRLPQVIHDLAGIKIVPFQVNSPNFISRKKVQNLKIFLDSRNYNLKLKNKIVMIENADPGFDWIFSQKILGLITKFGGVNSHMAIRCAELEIPAAIGCGEQRFETLKKLKTICLDCSASNLYGA